MTSEACTADSSCARCSVLLTTPSRDRMAIQAKVRTTTEVSSGNTTMNSNSRRTPDEAA